MTGGRTRRARCWVAAVAAGLACLPAPVLAQQEPAPDSAQERVRERLRRLARPVGADSVLFEQDSARLAEAQAGIRPGLASEGDTVLAALSSMPGFSLTRYEGGEADFVSSERILTLRAAPEGRAVVRREGIEVQADSSIVFDESTGLMRTKGMSTFAPPDNDPVDAADMVYDLNQERGSALGARTEFSEGGTRWYMTGDMPWAGQDSTFMSHARFTSCDLEEPHYHFESDQIKVVGGRILVARGVRLYFDDVPVAWLPFIAQDLEQGRASGLLTPQFSINDIVRTSSGYRRRVSNLGFYWAMSEYTDALVAADWFSDTFFSLRTQFQYRFNRQFLNGSVNVRRFWGAEGDTEFAFNTNHDWQPDERTRLQVSARYAKNDFVREFSFDPREVTQQITSTAGLSRRFDWGNLSLNANRSQYLSDDRVEWTLPQANLSLTSRTLFAAPATEARFWNNMTWSASTRFRRSVEDRLQEETFSYGTADTERTRASVGTSLGLGNLSISPSVSLTESRTRDVPEALPSDSEAEPDPEELLTTAPARDIGQATLNWSASVRYQQRLVGSTTLTPDLTLSGDLFRADTSSLASDFVAAPSRVSLGATLKSDVYGFFPGFGGFDAIRHKITPSITYEWTPEATPDELQRQVFGSRAIQPRNVVAVGFNQTFEARRPEDEDSENGAAADTAVASDSASVTDLTAGQNGRNDGEPRRIQRPPVVTLLGLNTNVVRYDFVEADSLGHFLAGFQTTQLSSRITSDYLRGLSVSMRHDLFADSVADGTLVERDFRPHLSSLNLGFSVSSRSDIFRWLGLAGGGDGEPTDDEEETDDLDDPFADDEMVGEGAMIPGGDRRGQGQAAGPEREQSGLGEWNASLSYALQRPRGGGNGLSQMVRGTVRLRPTENWDLSWRTAYDLEARAFNDHVIRLTRDLHRWQANFDFLKTATGNWSFRFEVSLTDNRDLKFDYRQRNLDVGLPSEGGGG
ncbi:MAG: putative LPS assembly protein LptD [Gemmatimonadota bacterium]|nr:putative LPS assembly protein LptD [Gemmatimonadota bacterium]